ncbi:FixH family protein [Roseococcus sp. SDR]|uniref:FixH family protein n=1 Tax=Roseococcus sp. SDR TaxID=2835532 RepID=UPI001BCF37AC|nr:FixH family protein [Roseococcus sp. SDR]MBS7790027.1 FixH family protein [Roseococcus sp. SDR]MBV1845341.1 FixH family protein [Roseococcus sp. SDR]
MRDIQAHDPNRGRWIPWVFVGGMAVVVAVNAVLITQAIGTFTGVTVGQSYDRGRTYNHVLAEAARQDALGWTLNTRLEGGRLTVNARENSGASVRGVLEGHMLRPLDGERVALPDTAGTGRFTIELPELRAGLWEFRGLLVSEQGARHDIRQRFTLP